MDPNDQNGDNQNPSSPVTGGQDDSQMPQPAAPQDSVPGAGESTPEPQVPQGETGGDQELPPPPPTDEGGAPSGTNDPSTSMS